MGSSTSTDPALMVTRMVKSQVAPSGLINTLVVSIDSTMEYSSKCSGATSQPSPRRA